MATTKKTEPKNDARDQLDAGTSANSELSAITVKSLTNLEEKVEAIDWKLWEIYNIIKNYVEANPNGVVPQVPQPSQPQASAADVAAELAKVLGQGEEKKSVVGKLFGK
tara:strand:+ start:49 stop:375 length:327 start_codon:yes stop_codon:yes gene_type:complete